jgi:class 3 adenylate cyclase
VEYQTPRLIGPQIVKTVGNNASCKRFKLTPILYRFREEENSNPMSLQQWAGVEDWNPRTTLVVLFTDIIDSTALARTVGDKTMFEMLDKHFEVARIKLMLYDAVEIKIIGDAYMAVFRTADDALQFALDFRADTGDPRIAIRVGIHVGPVRIKEDDIYGLMVNYAARLSHAQVSGEEGIFISDSAKANIEAEYGSTQKDFRFRQLASANLKGFPPGERVWDVFTPEIVKARIKRNQAKTDPKRSANASPVTNSAPAPTTPEKPTLNLGPRRHLVDILNERTEGPRRK